MSRGGGPARDTALAVVEALEDRDAFLQPALEAAARRAGLDPRDRGLALELAGGVVRWRLRLDHALAPHLRRGLEGTDPRLLRILRLAAYQLLMLDRVPDHAAVHAAVEQARQVAGEPTAGFVNGVLRALQRTGASLPAGDDPGSIAVRGSHPEWLVRRFIAELGPAEAEALCAANDAPAPLSLRVDGDRAEVAARLAAEGGVTEPGRFAPDALSLRDHPAPFAGESFRAGLWQAQDEAAQLVVLALDPQPGEAVWDVCAAPGGKARYAERRMGGQGRLLATDVNARKVERLRALLAGRPAVRVARHDGRTPPADGPFDRVLLDAPCTGLGTVRRHPEIKWRRRPEDVAAMAELQRALLASVAGAVAPGGVLVYSVCTTTAEEGPEQVAGFLAAHPEFRLEPPPDGAGVAWGPLLDAAGQVRTWPHRHGIDGFFAARLRRSA